MNGAAVPFEYEFRFDDRDQQDAVLYPNPARDFVTVRLDLINPSLTEQPEVNVEIRNILGNMMTTSMERVDANTLRIATSDFPGGYYLLMVRCQECAEGASMIRNTYKFLKQ
ncbi:MAG: T9SS type A sorting domain-containing protein [Cyclobacteriaceae bacterium]